MITTTMTLSKAKALRELGFEDIGRQIDSFNDAEARLRTDFTNIGSIIRYLEKHKEKDNSNKLNMLISCCKNSITDDTKTYFYSIDTAYVAKLNNISRCAEFVLERNDKVDSMLNQMKDSYVFLIEKMNQFFEAERAS
ncbi:MAG: hypothetical protein RBQ78_06315 [Acholeplasmataceae bacterium]|jgi:hypothetical protein|nr:hypothetical protein [Acholeplasmataceae bacterium]